MCLLHWSWIRGVGTAAKDVFGCKKLSCGCQMEYRQLVFISLHMKVIALFNCCCESLLHIWCREIAVCYFTVLEVEVWRGCPWTGIKVSVELCSSPWVLRQKSLVFLIFRGPQTWWPWAPPSKSAVSPLSKHYPESHLPLTRTEGGFFHEGPM